MKRTIFITGTDTDVGKTYASIKLLSYFNQLGYRTLGLKPIASGCEKVNQTWRNDDALQLSQEASIKLPYRNINPFAFPEAIAPHLAAKKANCSLTIETLNEKTAYALSYPADICLVEGAGGWLLPLNDTETYADYVLHHAMEIILVVRMKLGCINHALLSCDSITRSGGKLIGWIANSFEKNMPYLEENIATLKTWLPAPHLGTIMPDTDILNFKF